MLHQVTKLPHKLVHIMIRTIKYSLLVLLLTGFSTAFGQSTFSIQQSVDMRSGPGSYYELVLRLNKGAQVTELEKEATWMKVRIDDKEGWIPEQSTYLAKDTDSQKSKESDSPSSSMDDAFSELEGGESSSEEDAYASPAQVAAAVKGFARKYTTKRSEKTVVDLTRSFDDRINPKEYRRFRRDRMGNWTWKIAQSRFPLRTDTIPTMTPEIEKMGWGIANALAQNGLVQNRELLEYLNYVAAIVTESSHRYETPVQIHVLDSDDITGYACPNGIIFISKGALQVMESEAEVAFFIAHELAHVVLQHGVKESKDRRSKIKADDAFSELEDDLDYDERQDDKYVQTSQDLTQWADQVYEYIIHKKLERYEFQADFWGVVYAYRAGYNPDASMKLLQRILNKQGDFEKKMGELDWQGASLETRIDKLNSYTKKMDLAERLNRDYKAAYQNKKQLLY